MYVITRHLDSGDDPVSDPEVSGMIPQVEIMWFLDPYRCHCRVKVPPIMAVESSREIAFQVGLAFR